MPVIKGFLPFSRATIMFDVVAVALLLLVPMLILSVILVKRGYFEWHKRIQLALSLVLLVAVILFEVDVQMTKLYVPGGWRSLTVESPYQGTPIDYLLRVHLVFATATAVLLLVTVPQAYWNFPKPAAPSTYSKNHKLLGWATTIGLLITCTTGWTFYYMAFVATKGPA